MGWEGKSGGLSFLLWHWVRSIWLVLTLSLLASCGSGDKKASVEEAPPARPAAPAAASADLSDKRPIIVAFGDSLSAGFGADPGKSYPDFLQKDLDAARSEERR